MTTPTIAAIEAIGATPDITRLEAAQPAAPGGATSFSKLLLDGVGQVNDKMMAADAAVKAFALDDSIPLHQVTFALEQSRLSFELMLQVRGKLVESYQEIMRMQL